MLVLVLAIVVTAALVGVATAGITQRRVLDATTAAIGGREGADPVREHHRLVGAVQRETAHQTDQVDQIAAALNALHSGVIITDASGTVLIRNNFATDITPRSHERTLVGATAAELIAVAATGSPVDREVTVFGPPSRVLSLKAVPIVSNGEVVGTMTVIDDVTEHHQLEKTRRDFVANLSHELRTPIGALSLLAEMLNGEEDAETRDRLSGRLVAETERLALTIDDLLALSRIESETEQYNDEIVVQDLFDDVANRTRVLAEARDIEVVVITPPERISLVGNYDQLVSALVNLVDNAVKYSDEGESVSLRVRLEEGVLIMTVQDTGHGIPGRDIDRIFERFYRVDRSRDSSTGGTGIGLSIVRHVALNHGGAVSVSSFEGEGSTFTIEIPHVVANTAPSDAREAAS